MANRTKITMAGARAFAAADGSEAVLWDSAAPGLGLRARANGRKTWIVHRRRNGSVVKRTLGAFDALTVEDARHAARVMFADSEGHGTPPRARPRSSKRCGGSARASTWRRC